MIFIGALLLILAAVVVAVAGRRGRGGREPGFAPEAGKGSVQAVPWDAERVFIYALSFAGLLATLYAISGLLANVIVTITQQSNALAGSSSVRDRTSYYLASIVVGLPIWLGLWRLAERRADRSPQERQSPERRLYLAGIFATASIVALFGLQGALSTVLTLPDTADRALAIRDGIFSGARLLVWGTAWLVYARIGWSERSPRDQDEAHDLAVYALSGTALAFLVIGLYGAVHEILADLTATTASTSLWSTWGSIAAWILSGGPVWGAIWRYDLARGRLRSLRIIYLYVVLALAVAAVLGGGVDTLYEIVRRIFGYQVTNNWSFLQDSLPPLLIGAGVWAYHWSVMRRQATFAGETDLAPGAIPWPRHPGFATLDLVGLGMFASAFTSLLWLAIDALFRTGVALSSGDWWRDRLSIGLAAGLIGALVWLSSWSILQRATRADPRREAAQGIRLRLLGLILIVSTLVALGFTVALLWTVIRAALDGTFDTGTASRALKDLSAALIALALAGYHGAILRRERGLQPVQKKTLRTLALVAPGGEALLDALSQGSGRAIELIGQIAPGGVELPADGAATLAALDTLEHQEGTDGVLLILRPDGIALQPYVKTPAREPSPLPGPSPQVGDSAPHPV